MKDKILEILIDKIKATPHDFYPTGIEGLPQSAREIADMVQKFVEWLAENHVEHHPKFNVWIRHENWKERLTFDELFSYWFENIYNIKDKKG